MTIHQLAHYQVKAGSVEKVKRAIREFVAYVQKNEPGAIVYSAWQQKDDPTRFTHIFIFRDEAAHATHGASKAVKEFEAAYGPELVGGPVEFVDYEDVASKS